MFRGLEASGLGLGCGGESDAWGALEKIRVVWGVVKRCFVV